LVCFRYSYEFVLLILEILAIPRVDLAFAKSRGGELICDQDVEVLASKSAEYGGVLAFSSGNPNCPWDVTECFCSW
jgi:hypothetical protein